MSAKKLFGINGIRGIINKELTPEIAVNTGSAIGAFFKSQNLLVGHHARTSDSYNAKLNEASRTL
jgi:phosphomannomutase/phosphoglucomutase